MARLFLAFELPERLRERLTEEVARLKGARADIAWVRPEKFHVTLRFVGDVDDLGILDLARLLQTTATASDGPLDLVCRGLGSFPESGTPRVIWAGVHGRNEDEDSRMQDLRRRLHDGVRALGYRPEKGPFHAHVTLGRAKGSEGLDAVVERMGPMRKREFAHFAVPEIVLFESHETEIGTSYTAIERATLGRHR